MGHRCRPSREEGGPEAPGGQRRRHLLVKALATTRARRTASCPSRYQTFRSGFLGFITRFEGLFCGHGHRTESAWISRRCQPIAALAAPGGSTPIRAARRGGRRASRPASAGSSRVRPGRATAIAGAARRAGCREHARAGTPRGARPAAGPPRAGGRHRRMSLARRRGRLCRGVVLSHVGARLRDHGSWPTPSRPAGPRSGPRPSPRWEDSPHRSRDQRPRGLARFAGGARRFGLQASLPAHLDQSLLDPDRRTARDKGNLDRRARSVHPVRRFAPRQHSLAGPGPRRTRRPEPARTPERKRQHPAQPAVPAISTGAANGAGEAGAATCRGLLLITCRSRLGLPEASRWSSSRTARSTGPGSSRDPTSSQASSRSNGRR